MNRGSGLTIRTPVLLWTSHDASLRQRPSRPRVPSGALGRRRASMGRSDPAAGPGSPGDRAASGRDAARSPARTAGGSAGRAGRAHRLRRPGRDPRPGRVAQSGHDCARGGWIQRQDHTRAPGRRPGASGRRHRRLRGPGPEPGSGRGGGERGRAGVARRPDAGFARRGTLHGGHAPPGSDGRPSAAGPRERPPGCSHAGPAGERPERDDGPAGRSNPAAGGHRPAGGGPADRPPASGPFGADLGRGRSVGRVAARAAPAGLDQARAGGGRPADGGERGPEQECAARPDGRAPDHVRGRRPARRVSSPRRPVA